MPYKDREQQKAALRRWRSDPDNKQADRVRKRIERRIAVPAISFDPSVGAGDDPEVERQIVAFLAKVRQTNPDLYEEVFRKYPVLSSARLRRHTKAQVAIDDLSDFDRDTPPAKGTIWMGQAMAKGMHVDLRAYGLDDSFGSGTPDELDDLHESDEVFSDDFE